MWEELQREIQGDLRSDLMSQQIYSVDASLYEMTPLAVLLPKTADDIKKGISFASSHNIPVTPRGGGTGIAGGCLGKGLIIDMSKYFNRILEINSREKYAIVEPGLLQDELNRAAGTYGLRLGPDTSTGNRATMGGMVGANAAGIHSLHYGNMGQSLLELELLLSNGETMLCGSLSRSDFEKKEGGIFEVLKKVASHRNLIESQFPKIKRRASGYNLDSLLETPVAIPKLIAGSEGTLGILTKIKVALQPLPEQTTLAIIPFPSIEACLQQLPNLLAFTPFSCELISEEIIAMGRLSPSLVGKMDLFPSHHPFVAIEFEGKESEQKLRELCHFFKQTIPLPEGEQRKTFWALRKGGLGLLLSRRSYSRAIAFLEDMAVPLEKLSEFVGKLTSYFHLHRKKIVLYGHLGEGCLHLRPYFDLRQDEELHLVKKMMDDLSTLLREEEGVLSSEHGNGLVRSWLHPKMFGSKIYDLFLQVKQAFDPLHIMNPGKITAAPSPLENLRLNPTTKIKEIPTFLDFSPEGGFALSVSLCNGNGECRKLDGIMCPSYQVTQDERYTTRARAQVLQSLVYGKMEMSELTQDGIHDVLDYCLECKGCKTECPSQVDMAKIKSEVLYHRQKEKGIPLRSWLFGNIAFLSKWGSKLGPFGYWLQNGSLSKRLLGIAPQRTLPSLAPHSFSSLWRGQKKGGKKVVLFNDTFTQFYEPSIGLAAATLLEELGYEVIIPPWHCCGRPLISKGLLPQARKKALSLLEILDPYIDQNIPLLGLEPSCLFTLRDDFPSLINKEKVKKMSSLCLPWDYFMGRENLSFKTYHSPILYHRHCHEKALLKEKHSFPRMVEIPSGCCGLAGSFGYEKEHYEMSIKIGEHLLFPSIKASPEAVVVANGFSCRNQISHGTGRKALHIAEILKEILDI